MPTEQTEATKGSKTEKTVYQLPEAFAATMAAGRSVFGRMLVNQIKKGETKISDIPEEGILGIMELCADLIEDKSDLKIALENTKDDLETMLESLNKARTNMVDIRSCVRGSMETVERCLKK